MAIIIARFIGMRHANIPWKSEEDVYAFGISDHMMKLISALKFHHRKMFPSRPCE
jgi:hypothetical protein